MAHQHAGDSGPCTDCFEISPLSWLRLKGVHPKLIGVYVKAHTAWAFLHDEMDFQVTEGVRSEERQLRLVNAGKSRTMESKHLTGRALDFHCVINGKADWDFENYRKVARMLKGAAASLNVEIVWGGDWSSFKDGPHIELADSEE